MGCRRNFYDNNSRIPTLINDDFYMILKPILHVFMQLIIFLSVFRHLGPSCVLHFIFISITRNAGIMSDYAQKNIFISHASSVALYEKRTREISGQIVNIMNEIHLACPTRYGYVMGHVILDQGRNCVKGMFLCSHLKFEKFDVQCPSNDFNDQTMLKTYLSLRINEQ